MSWNGPLRADDSALSAGCNLLMAGAHEATGEVQNQALGMAGKWGGRFLEKLFGKMRTLHDVEVGAGLATTGLSGAFLGEHRIADFTLEANRALAAVLAKPELAERFGRQLVRLGVLSHTEKKPEFARFYVLAHNQPIDLEEPVIDSQLVDDDVLHAYLGSLLKSKIAAHSPPTLVPVSAAERLTSLLALVQTGLTELDPNPAQRERSIKSLDFALTEAGKLSTAGHLTAEAFDSIFDQLMSSAEFRTRELNIPAWARITVGKIPFINLFFIPWDLVNTWYYRESKLAISRHEVDRTDIWHKRTPQTLHLYFANRDIKNLTAVAEAFVAKYADRNGPPVFTDAFAEDFLATYPEVREYFAEFYTNEMMVPHPVAGEAFGNYHQEIKKILVKAANLFSVLREDHTVFPHVSNAKLSELHAMMLADLELNHGDGTLNVDRVDMFITSFIISALGKARNPMIDSIADEYDINNKAGSYDYNRRALYLLHHYRTLSYSFSRRDSSDQSFLAEIMDHNYQATFTELLRLEAPKESFVRLHEMEPHHMNFMFYQFLLSESKERQHQLTINAGVLESWMELKKLLVADTDFSISPAAAYTAYIDWLRQRTNLRTDQEWDRVVLRLRAIMGLPASELATLENEVQLLTPAERELFIQLLDRSPVFFHRLNELFNEMLVENGAKNLPLTETIDDFLVVMTRMLSSIRDQHFEFARITNADHAVRVFVRPVVEKLQEDAVGPRDLGGLNYEMRHYAFGEVIYPVEPKR